MRPELTVENWSPDQKRVNFYFHPTQSRRLKAKQTPQCQYGPQNKVQRIYANKFVEDFFSSQFMIESNMKSFHKVQCTGGILCIAETTLCQGFEFSEKSSNLQLASATQKYCFYSRSMAIKP